MYSIKKVILNCKGRKYSFLRDGRGYFFESPSDEKKYRDTRSTFKLPVGDKSKTIEEFYAGMKDNQEVYRIGHVEMRNFSFNANMATIFYQKNGKDCRKILKDESDIEITIEDGIYCDD